MLGTRGSGLDAVWEKISLGRAANGGGSVLGRSYLISISPIEIFYSQEAAISTALA